MTARDRRRQSKRYSVNLKTAVVFDKKDNRPVFHTQTQDLSTGGAAIYSERGDLEGVTVTVLIDRPPGPEGEQRKMLRMRAQVVSCVHVPAKSAYRLGLKFLPSGDDTLNALAEVLNAVEQGASAAPAAGETAPAAPAPANPTATAPVPAGGRLAQLKQLAQAKQNPGANADPQAELKQRVDGALRKAFAYLKELVDNLNVVKPPFPKPYVLAGAPPLDGLTWDGGQVVLRTGEPSRGSKLCEQVGLYFRLSGRRQMQVARENPAHEKLRQVLVENKIEFTTREARNDRGTVERTTFLFPCEVNAQLLLVADYRNGTIEMSTQHVERFGMVQYRLAPEAISDESLEQLTAFILGEQPTIGSMTQRRG